MKEAECAFRHLVGVLMSCRDENNPLGGPSAGPWSELLREVTEHVTSERIGYAQALLESVLQSRQQLTVSQRRNLGVAARSILQSAQEAPRRNGPLIKHALRSVCGTFDTDPAESVKVLRRSIERNHLQKYGHEELAWITRAVAQLAKLDAEFVADLYIAVFDWSESADDSTQMGSSRILPLRSTRKQDYNHARWELGQQYPSFLAAAPVAATRAMVAAVEAHCRGERDMLADVKLSLPDDDASLNTAGTEERHRKASQFTVNGITAHFVPDYAHIWEQGSVPMGGEAVSLLGSFFQYLDSIVSDEQARGLVDEILEVIIRHNRRAAVWIRLLKVAAKHPWLALRLKDLACASPLLLASEAGEEIEQFLKALYPSLLEADKHLLEQHILKLPTTGDEDRDKVYVAVRDRLIGAIADFDLVEEEAQLLASKLRSGSTASDLPRRHSGPTQWSGDHADWWRDMHGVDTESAVNRALLKVEDPVKRFNSNHSNSFPTLLQAKHVFPDLIALREFLSQELPEAADRVAESALAELAVACSRIARVDGLDGTAELARFVEGELLLAAKHKFPESNLEREEQFDRTPAWSQQPRITAAEGLLALTSKTRFAQTAVLNALDLLARDSSAVVRYHIACDCTALHETDPGRMWTWLQELSQDSSTAVREGAVASLHRVAELDADRALRLIVSTAETTSAKQAGAGRVQRVCAQSLVTFYMWRGNPIASAAIDKIISNLATRRSEAAEMLFTMRAPLTHGEIDASEEIHAIRRRAVQLLSRLAVAACEPVLDMLKNQIGRSSLSTEQAVHFEALTTLTNGITSEIYFASGAFQPNRAGGPALTRPEQERFYWEADGIFDRLAEVGFPGLAHHLAETMEMYIPIDPAGVFLRVAAIVRAGRTWGYQYEELAQNLIVRIVERYLAEYRSLLQQNLGCQTALRETLETFIDAGSSRAQALAYSLDEIFR